MGTRRRTRRGGVYGNRDEKWGTNKQRTTGFLARREDEQRRGVDRPIGLPAQSNLMEQRAELEQLAINRPPDEDKTGLKEWDAKVARLLPTVRATEQAYFRALLAKLPTKGADAEVPPPARPPPDFSNEHVDVLNEHPWGRAGRRRTRKHKSRRRRSRRHR